jgi:CHAD domain-containing protein
MEENYEIVVNSGKSLLVETLEKRWQIYRSELKRCQKEPGEEAIHDLRVATRRLLALIDMLRTVFPHPKILKMRRVFKNRLNNLNDLRDTQVMLMDVSETLAELPELAPFHNYLAKREKRLLKSANKNIKSYKSTSLRKRIDSTRKTLLKKKINKNLKKEDLLQVVDDTYKTAMRRFRRIDSEQPATVHRFRVAFKKFRYLVEIVHPFVPDFPEGNFKSMHDYQGLMGNIQDLEVISSVFDDFVDKDATYNPEAAPLFYNQRHTEAVQAFVKDMHQISTYWRPGPGTLFPWEPRKSASAKKTAGTPPAQVKAEQGEQVEVQKEAKQ